MNVLIANDDGINARGIRALVDALSPLANVYIFAPDTQKSGFSHALTTSHSIHVAETEYDGASAAFAVSGTPADCVKVGYRVLKARGIDVDIVYSGINQGSNLGTDTIYSGTVGAAIEGNICGIPAVAVSVDSHDAQYFDYAAQLAASVLEVAADKISENMTLNINVPNVPAEEVKGVKYTVLGERNYNEYISPEDASQKEFDYNYGGEPLVYDGLPDTIDVIAHQKGYATITPLQRDMTFYGKVEEIKNWGITR